MTRNSLPSIRLGAACRELTAGRAAQRPAAGRRCWARIPGVGLLTAGVLLSVVSTCCVSVARGQGPVLAAIKEIDHAGLYSERFTLKRDARVAIEAVGSGWPDEKLLFSYAWLLNLSDRTVAWKMDYDNVDADRDDNVSATGEMLLPAGEYALYFSALGGFFPIKKEIKLLKLFQLGTFNVHGGTQVAWDRYGRPAKWKAVVRAVEPGFRDEDFVPNAPRQMPAALVAFREAGSGELFQAALDVRQKTRVRILALGEYVAREQGFADGAWIEDLDVCERAWEMSLRNTEPAGGATKNRVFDGIVELAPGRYGLYFATDDSHAFGDWNAPPPYDPESWGVTLMPIGPLPAGAVSVASHPPEENLLVKIDRVGDRELHRMGFELRRAADLCVRGFGEWGHNQASFVDYGWIENAQTLARVWTMQDSKGIWAGGESRNRVVQDRVHLPAGSYYLCYLSDYAHAYPRWSKAPPYDPRAWGISLRGLGRDFDAAAVRVFEEADGPVTIVRLAPVGDDAREHVSFAVSEPTRVKVIAVGEGERDEMFDYAWLTRKDSGTIIWKMEYADSSPAGGAKKNRRVEVFVTLEPGEYTLHYRSDGSHSIDGWNDDPPEEPQYWGVTLLEWTAGRGAESR